MGSILPKDTIDNHSFLAEELLIPNAQKSDAGRLKMLTDHQGQLVTITNAEPPKVFSGFENQIGKYSSGYKQPKENYEVIKIIELNVNHKFIIIKTESGQYDVIVYKAVENLTEYFGHSNTLHEDVKEGAKIDIEETPYVYKNGMYDENMNLQYGRNLKALFIPYKGLTYEDAIVISDEIAELMTHDEVKDYYLVLNKNDVLLNLRGKNGEYKPLPEINEYIQNHILVSRRRIDYNTLLYNFKSDEFTTPQRDDSSVFATGQLKDIFIYSNVLEDTPVNQPFKKILKQQFETFVDLHAHLEDIKLKHNDKVSENFNYWFQYARDYISPDKDTVLPYTYDNRSFEGIVIKFTVSVKVPCEIGSKLTGRYGSKGVISAILPKKEMPKVEGTDEYADVVLNPGGVLGRMNLSQLYEQELNFITNFITSKYKGKKKVDLKGFKEDLIKFYEVVSPDFLAFLEENVFSDKDNTKEFLEETLEHGFMIEQKPFFNNITLDQMKYLYTEVFPVPKIKFENIEKPLVFGEIYYMKLKHLAHGKYSVRSAEMSNLLDVPYKNNEQYKKGTALFNANPLALGEQEFIALSTLDDTVTTEKFRASYSSSRIARQSMFEKLFTIDNIDELDSIPWDERMENSSAPAQTIKALFNGIGIKLEKKLK